MKSALILIAVLSVGCSSNYNHAAHEREMTLGVVQKEIREGMDQGEVAAALGSPNIVTKDERGAQTWIYDKIASEVSYSQAEGGVWLLLGGYHKTTGGKASIQKTLTVVIKFNENSRVDKLSYHSSKF